MINAKALPKISQSCDDVLYFDADASPTEIYECATARMDAAFHMLEALSTAVDIRDTRALPAIASAAAMLLSDASGMLASLYGVIREHEDLVNDVAGMQALISARDV